MFMRIRFPLIGCALLLVVGALAGQPTPPPPIPPKATVEVVPAKDLVAASVNGQTIPELALYRGLLGVAPTRREAMRKEVLNFLIDNTIVDQYLIQLKIQIEPKEMEENIDKIKEQAKKDGLNWEQSLAKIGRAHV